MNSTDLLAILLLLLLLIYKPPLIEPNTHLLNIYGEPLVPCQRYSDDSRGLWDNQGYCSETGGGVHQICFQINQETQSFSSDTGQSNWSETRISDERRENNHCMCLGAWALYKAKQKSTDPDIRTEETNDELKCESIPDTALSSRYINKWNRWNGNELDGQIVNGITSIYTQCMDKAVTQSQQNNLQTKYNELRASVPELPEYP